MLWRYQLHALKVFRLNDFMYKLAFLVDYVKQWKAHLLPGTARLFMKNIIVTMRIDI